MIQMLVQKTYTAPTRQRLFLELSQTLQAKLPPHTALNRYGDSVVLHKTISRHEHLQAQADLEHINIAPKLLQEWVSLLNIVVRPQDRSFDIFLANIPNTPHLFYLQSGTVGVSYSFPKDFEFP